MNVRRLLQFLRYQVILAREIVLSAIGVTKLVLGPQQRLRSGFLVIPLEAETDLEITVLANSITLTPGTITVHVEPRHRTLMIHAIDIGENPDDVRRSIKSVLEANILKWTRASGRKPAR